MNRSIDGLRGIAVLMVMLFHAGGPLTSAGWIGVDLFFVLSGFLITSLLLTEYDRNGKLKLGSFWARRFLRLMPVYVLYLTGVTLAMALAPSSALSSHGGWSPGEFLASLWTYLGNLPPRGGIWTHQYLTQHLWSLSVEEQFYFAWPLLLVALLKTRRLEPFAWAVVLLTLLHNGFGYDGSPPRSYIHTRGIGLFIGCATAITLSRHRAWLEASRLLSARATDASLAATALSFIAITFLSERDGLSISQSIPLAIPVFAVSVAALIANLWVRPASRTGRLLCIAPLPKIGAISYGAYVYHMLAWHLVWVEIPETDSLSREINFGLRVLAYTALTFAMAEVSFRVIEEPCLRLKERFRPAPGLDAAASSSPP